MISLELVFCITALIVWILLWITFACIIRAKASNKSCFLLLIGTALATVPIYSLFIFADSYFWAMLFDALYFVCTDWLCLFMLLFVLSYASREKNIRGVSIALLPFLLTDTVSLIANTWKKHSFNLTKIELENEIVYWSCAFTPLHYIHLAFCYVMVLSALFLLVHCLLRSPKGYKAKYFAILAAFITVIAANAFCYSLDWVVDFSVLLYPLLAIFIVYYSFFFAPRRMLTQSLTSVNENIDDAILYFDVNDDCFYTNSKAKTMFKENGKFSPLKASEFLIHARGKNQAKSESRPVEFFTVNGQERQFEIETEDIYYDNNLIGSYLKLSDKTDEINKYLTQKFLATHDELTGAYTREHFFKVCDAKIRDNPNTEYLMISSNIRQFKLVNELFGEEVGNKILIKMVTSAKTLAIHDCVFGRIGDDRFGLLAQKQYFTEDRIKIFLESAQKVLEGSMYKLNLCVGVCEVHGNSESARLLYDKTQIAINKICNDYQKHLAYYNSDLMDELLRERQITTEFEDALNAGQIQMYLQPYFDKDQKVFGCEALSRWQHPQRGLMQPKSFISSLENSGLIHKLDSFIWEQAAILLEKWERQGIDNICVSVNVSTKDIFYIDIADSFRQLLLKRSFNPQNLKIEFTESVLTSDIGAAVKIFGQLKQLGFEVGIDDFGRGYSSLNYLKDVNADILKMDMAIAQKNDNSDRVKTILKFIVQISKAMDMKLISEGVESEEQLQMLKSLGFSRFQGYYFSEAIPIKDFEEKYL